MSDASFDIDDITEEDRRYLAKIDKIREAALKVESILGVYASPHRFVDSVDFFRTKADSEREGGYAERESHRLAIGINKNEDGGTYYPDAAAPLAIDDPWTCEPAPWKAAVLEEIRRLVTLDAEEAEYFDYATAVFRGEVIHPAVLNDIK